MIFVIHCLDNPERSALRPELLAEHRAFLRPIAQQMAFAGPLADASGTPVGTLIVAEFADESAVHAWLATEPFFKSGLFARVEVQSFTNRWPQKTGFPAV